MTIVETLHVVDLQGNRLFNINELEWIEEKGEQYVFANVYFQHILVKISMNTGKVVERLMLEDVYRQ